MKFSVRTSMAIALGVMVNVSSAADSTLSPLVVTATRQATRVSDQLADVTVIERDELEKAGHSSLLQVLSRVPGVEVTSNGGPGATSSIYMRGSSEKQVVVLIDGVRVGSASKASMESWSRAPLSQIERIEVLRGPASALYGSEAMGGVVQIFTRRGDGSLMRFAEAGMGSYDSQSLAAGLSGSANGLRYALNVASERTDGFSNRRRGFGGFNPDSDGFRDHSLSGSLGYRLGDRTEAGASLFYSDGVHAYDTTTNNNGGATADFRTKLAVTTFSSHVRQRLSDAWTSTLRVGRSVDDSSSFRDRALSSLFRTDQVQYQWQNDVETSVGTFLAGVEHLNQRVSGNTGYPAGKGERDVYSALLGWTGAFADHRWQANARHDANSQFGISNTGAVGYGYRIAQGWRATASYGTAFRAPSFNELYGAPSNGFVSNPNLVPETSRNKEVALHYEGGGHHLSLTAFDNRIKNMIPTGSVALTNVGHAALTGMTIAYEGRIGNLDVMSSLTAIDPRDEETGRQLRRRATRYGNVSVGQDLGQWEWRAELQASNHRFDDDANATRMGGYHVVNLYAAYRVNAEWSVFGRVNNLFDHDYSLAQGYTVPGFNSFFGVRYQPR